MFQPRLQNNGIAALPTAAAYDALFLDVVPDGGAVLGTAILITGTMTLTLGEARLGQVR